MSGLIISQSAYLHRKKFSLYVRIFKKQRRTWRWDLSMQILIKYHVWTHLMVIVRILPLGPNGNQLFANDIRWLWFIISCHTDETPRKINDYIIYIILYLPKVHERSIKARMNVLMLTWRHRIIKNPKVWHLSDLSSI